MKKTLYLITLALVCGLAMMGCKKEDPKPETPANDTNPAVNDTLPPAQEAVLAGVWKSAVDDQGQFRWTLIYDDGTFAQAVVSTVIYDIDEGVFVNGLVGSYSYDSAARQMRITAPMHGTFTLSVEELTQERLVLPSHPLSSVMASLNYDMGGTSTRMGTPDKADMQRVVGAWDDGSNTLTFTADGAFELEYSNGVTVGGSYLYDPTSRLVLVYDEQYPIKIGMLLLSVEGDTMIMGGTRNPMTLHRI